jgi:hypothetical protein
MCSFENCFKFIESEIDIRVESIKIMIDEANDMFSLGLDNLQKRFLINTDVKGQIKLIHKIKNLVKHFIELENMSKNIIGFTNP